MTGRILTCPDCGATEGEVSIEHLDGCPAALEIDRMSDRDRVWFETHPGATEYFREAMPGDFGVTSLDAFLVEGKVHVLRQGPGVRARKLPSVSLRLDVLEGLSPSSAYYLQMSSRAAELPAGVAKNLGLDGE